MMAGLATGVPALASNFGAGGGIYFADSATHDFFNDKLTSRFVNATSWVRTNVINPTDLNTTSASSHGANVDVVSMDGNFGCAWYGRVSCAAVAAGSKCNHWHVSYDLDCGALTDGEARSVVCEELGHTVGLRHGSTGTNRSSCLARPVNWSNVRWSSHDRAHVNGRY